MSHSLLGRILCVLLIAGSCTPWKGAATDGGSVASAHPLATEAGMAVLEQGGNAFDAAIAVAATLNVVEPMMSGIGGYGTILVYDAAEDRIRFLNPSGRFPAKTNTDLMRPPAPDYMKNRFGPKSISTPGNLNAWADMHAAYGKIPWGELFDKAILHAETGFVIDPFAAQMIEMAFEDFGPYPRSLYGKGGVPLQSGDTLVQKDLAETFRLVAAEGAAPFYDGVLGRTIGRKMEEVESFLTFNDLQNNEAEWWEPLKIDYRDYEVYTAALPANAFAAFVNLGLMKQFSAAELEHNSPEYLHLFAEMTKESYKARLAYSFDPEVREAPIDSLLSPAVLQSMAAAISRERATDFVPPFSEESRNTTHFVVIDQWGNIVSATQTLGNVFGSRIMVDGTGIWMNNSMAYSTFEPKGNPMDAFPGRHKLSGDCPVIIMKNGRSWAAVGSPGGHTITQNVPQIIINLIDFDMTMQEAIDAPKIAFVEPNNIRVEPHMPEAAVDFLIQKGHQVVRAGIGNAHGIKVLRDKKGEIIGYETGVDFRRSGRAPVMDH